MSLRFKNGVPVIVSPRICAFAKKVLGFSIGAVAIFPFIIVRDETIYANEEYINHESIHLRQYLETAIVGLLIIAPFEYLYARFVLGRSRMQAYYYMAHEQEAHQNDTNLDYLKTRKWFSYYRYLLPKNKKKFDLIDGKRVIF